MPTDPSYFGVAELSTHEVAELLEPKMSLVRFGEDGSDLYIYDDVHDGLKCCACALHERPFGSVAFGKDKNALLLHINEHIEAGHHVPSWLMHEVRNYNVDE